jgi:hypothetical protein
MTFSFGTSKTVSYDTFWKAVRAYWKAIPTFNDAGNYEYWGVFHGEGDALIFSFFPWFALNHTLAELKALTAPLFKTWKDLGIEFDFADSRSSQPTDKTEEAWNQFYQFWHLIMSSPNETSFKERVASFEKKYLPDHLHEVGYIKHTWLEPYKEKLAKAWVDQHTHFGNTATSRVEGIHALLKPHLKTSTLYLFEAWRAMKQALLNQLSELRSNQIRQQTRFPIELSEPLQRSTWMGVG